MSLSKFESEVKALSVPQAQAYARFSDLRNLEQLKAALSDPAVQERLAQQVPADKLGQLQEYAQQMKLWLFTRARAHIHHGTRCGA